MKRALSKRSNEVAEGRSAQVVRAAYDLIAEKGFEGLRTRDVADRVGINIATLHYYFPTKEALIQGVVQHLMQELKTSRVPAGEAQGALDLLRSEFDDIKIRLREAPEQLVVLTELSVRAWRDPEIAQILKYLDRGWHSHLVSIIKAGIEEGAFRSDLDFEATASALMSQLRGIGYQSKLNCESLELLVEEIRKQIESWILADGRPSPKPDSGVLRKRGSGTHGSHRQHPSVLKVPRAQQRDVAPPGPPTTPRRQKG